MICFDSNNDTENVIFKDGRFSVKNVGKQKKEKPPRKEKVTQEVQRVSGRTLGNYQENQSTSFIYQLDYQFNCIPGI